MTDYVLIIATFGFVILSAVLALKYYWSIRRKITEHLPRNPIATGSQIFSQQLFVLLAILGFAWFGGYGLADIGASKTVNPVIAFLAGIVVYFLVLGVIEVSAYLLGMRERLHDLSFETMRSIWPREKAQKLLAVIAVCILNPITEEVVYRGVIVYFFGSFIENFILAAVICLVLSLAAHLYQGTWSLPFQALFHGAAIALVLSPLGLFACFGLHFAGDLVPVVTMRSNMKAWKERRRQRRSAH